MPDNLKSVIEGWGQATIGLVGFLPTAGLARWLYHHRLVTLGHRRLFGRELLWEAPAVLFGAIIGGGVAEWAGLNGMAAHAVIGFVTWLGPRGLEEFVLRPLVNRYGGSGREKGEQG